MPLLQELLSAAKQRVKMSRSTLLHVLQQRGRGGKKQCKKQGCTWDAHTKTCSDPGHEAAAQKVKPVDTNVVIQEPDFSNSGSTVLLNVVMMLANVVMMMLILFGVHF